MICFLLILYKIPIIINLYFKAIFKVTEGRLPPVTLGIALKCKLSKDHKCKINQFRDTKRRKMRVGKCSQQNKIWQPQLKIRQPMVPCLYYCFMFFQGKNTILIILIHNNVLYVKLIKLIKIIFFYVDQYKILTDFHITGRTFPGVWTVNLGAHICVWWMRSQGGSWMTN